MVNNYKFYSCSRIGRPVNLTMRWLVLLLIRTSQTSIIFGNWSKFSNRERCLPRMGITISEPIAISGQSSIYNQDSLYEASSKFALL